MPPRTPSLADAAPPKPKRPRSAMTLSKHTPSPQLPGTNSRPSRLALATLATARVSSAPAAEAARTIAWLHGHLRTMTAEVDTAERRERERIACQLHDELGHHLVLVRLKLGEVRAASPCEVQGLVGELTELIARTTAAARSITFDLGRPAWHDGLFGALEALGSNLARQAGIEVRIDAPPAALRLADPQLGLVRRVVRELCLNVHKHARAREVHIASALDSRGLRVSVQDDGDGLRRPAPALWEARRDGGFGLASAQAQLRAFGGELELVSQPGCGTCASVVLPLPHGAGQALARAS